MKNVLVLFGGKSSEHDISLITANLCLNAIDEEEYKIFPILVNKNNEWFYVKNFKNNIMGEFKKEKVFLNFGSNVLYLKKGLICKKLVDVDCAILCHHGLNGEDGTIQSVLKLCNIPFSSSGVLESAITMDKVIMKQLLKSNNFNVVNYYNFNKTEFKENNINIIKEISTKLGFPVIIKPANLGSSIGINIAKNKKELYDAINIALEFDNKILVEEAKTNFKEINCACLGVNNDILVSSLEEPINWKNFLTFKDKYENSNVKIKNKIYPAKVNKDIEKKIKETTKNIFKTFNLSGVVRIDYILTENDIFVNEINSIPGSLAYYLFEKEGLTFSDVINKLIKCAEVKFNEEQNLTYAYESNVLNQKNINK